jgi:diadenosine tetraphosphate (Ap4A) HIT family hydrolase
MPSARHSEPPVETTCPFCRPSPERILKETPLIRVLRDGYPVSPGHTLVTTRRHVSDLFEVTPEEREAIWEAVSHVRERLQAEYHPDGFNIGVNVGAAAGQTVFHVHVHVIPRYKGDVAEPHGGIRGVIPGKALY